MKKALFAILILGIIASMFVIFQRIRVESANRAVDVVIDYDEIDQMASSTGDNSVTILEKFKKSGTTAVAVNAQTFGDALRENEIIPAGINLYIIPSSSKNRILKYLKIVLPKNTIIKTAPHSANPFYTMILFPDDLSSSYLESLPIGFRESAISAVKKAGLQIIARLPNYNGANSMAIDRILKDVKSVGIKKLIFTGDQILGFKGSEKETAKLIVKNGLYFGKVEFSKQKGEEKVAENCQSNTIIVHSITQAEMPNLSLATIIERFQKAARERGVRICYVRMYYNSSDSIVKDNAEYLNKVAKSIKTAGYEVKESHPLNEVKVPAFVRLIVAAGVAAGAVLLVLSIVEIAFIPTLIMSLIFVIGCVGLTLIGGIGQKAVALLSAIVFPTFAVLKVVDGLGFDIVDKIQLIKIVVLKILTAIGITISGGLLIAGLLSQKAYMLRIEQFAGVKAAHFLPILILTILYAGGLGWQSLDWGELKSKVVEHYRKILNNPILLWQAVGGLVVIVMLALMIARSGNDSGLEVSALELKFRSILDKIMVVRPRTKEFIIGYPALFLGIAYTAKKMKNVAAPLLIIGAFGLVSALNTFCHLHTPILISIHRTVNGIILGLIIGIVIYRLIAGKSVVVKESVESDEE